MGRVVMSPLDKEERAFVDKLLEVSTFTGRKEHQAYLQSDSIAPETLGEIEVAQSLYRKGWVKSEVDIIAPAPVWLTFEAWKRFALDEWLEIEDREIDKKRSDISGSW